MDKRVHCLRCVALFQERIAEVVEDIGIVGRDSQRVPHLRDAFVEMAAFAQGDAEVAEHIDPIGIAEKRGSVGRYGGFNPARRMVVDRLFEIFSAARSRTIFSFALS